MNKLSSWQPSASIEHLKKRAVILNKIRAFFTSRGLLEVETPLLSHASVTDIHLTPFQSNFNQGQTPHPVYLATSPEFHMKRLLAAGADSIFQICKAFRDEELGKNHNPEFTMLEWYRVGFDHHQLMDEMDDFLREILACNRAERISYQDVFIRYLNLCPLTASVEALQQKAISYGFVPSAEENALDSDVLLQFLFAFVVEPEIGKEAPVFVYNFPASQAALAKVHPEDRRVAERFEVYYQGMELANGFHELDDAHEQQQRFLADNSLREQLNMARQPIDNHLLAALSAGLPACAGVALGIDRLVMLAIESDSIAEVLSFAFDRA